ncbi:tetratricopeptide repeat protein [Candidatus Saccharibacteria bacterium CPR2]|nr:tetratricopeptide repeat protein [Candidatus Saccharibacteria bacterium CPR2]
MFATVAIAFLGVFSVIVTHRTQRSIQPLSRKVSLRLQKLWDDAHLSIRQHKYLRAEKALLIILKFDQKNAAAYSRLGILYTKQHEFKDAIHCFEVASSLAPNASSFHNLGLVYFEAGEYEKAYRAFEQALEIENDVASRHVAFAKVLEKLGQERRMIEALEKAVELEPNPQSYILLADAYERTGNDDLAAEIRRKLKKLIMPAGRPKRIQQPRKVVM